MCNVFSKENDLSITANCEYYYSLRKKYKATIQKKKRNYQNKIRSELETFHSHNQNDYWKLWDKLKTKNSTKSLNVISLQSFVSYFTEGSCPPKDAVSNFDVSFLEKVKTYL